MKIRKFSMYPFFNVSEHYPSGFACKTKKKDVKCVVEPYQAFVLHLNTRLKAGKTIKEHLGQRIEQFLIN